MTFKTATKLVLPFTVVILLGSIHARKFQDKNRLFQKDRGKLVKKRTQCALGRELLLTNFNIWAFVKLVTLSFY